MVESEAAVGFQDLPIVWKYEWGQTPCFIKSAISINASKYALERTMGC